MEPIAAFGIRVRFGKVQGSLIMIAQDALAGLEAGLITEAEALEQAGVQDIDDIRDVAGEDSDSRGTGDQ